MTRNPLIRIYLFCLVALAAGAAAAQAPTWNRAADVDRGVRGMVMGTVTDVDPAHSRISIATDADPNGSVVIVNSDSVATTYSGFGSADSRSSVRGSDGFGRVRVGDRIQVRGIGSDNSTIAASDVLLLGRSVSPNLSTSTQGSGLVEGVVRQIDQNQYRLTIETDRRDLLTVYGSSSTPVYFHGDTYHIPDIEVGDRIRVTVDTNNTDSGIRPRQIDVISSVSDTSTGNGTDNGTVTSVVGKVSRIDTRAETFRISRAGGDEVKVDARFATDSNGRTYRLSDLKVGDLVEVTGQYLSNDSFRADGIRPAVDSYPDRSGRPRIPNTPRKMEDTSVISTVVIYGTVTEGLNKNEILRVKDSSNNQVVEVSVLDDFPVRQKGGGYGTADGLKKGDQLVVQTYRCGTHYFAQTIRVR
jgi:hypothetical protein